MLRAASRAALNAGNSIAINTAIIDITTKSSIKVNADCFIVCKGFMVVLLWFELLGSIFPRRGRQKWQAKQLCRVRCAHQFQGRFLLPRSHGGCAGQASVTSRYVTIVISET